MEEETNNSKAEEKEERIPEDVERKIMENINRGETRRKRSSFQQFKNGFLQLMLFDQSLNRWVPGTDVYLLSSQLAPEFSSFFHSLFFILIERSVVDPDPKDKYRYEEILEKI